MGMAKRVAVTTKKRVGGTSQSYVKIIYINLALSNVCNVLIQSVSSKAIII
jgi:hypothetical protein